jgi:hypothetical protein
MIFYLNFLLNQKLLVILTKENVSTTWSQSYKRKFILEKITKLVFNFLEPVILQFKLIYNIDTI